MELELPGTVGLEGITVIERVVVNIRADNIENVKVIAQNKIVLL